MMEVTREQVDLQQMGRLAKAAAIELAQCSTEQKNAALLAIADALAAERAEILAVNAEDMAAARDAGTDPLYIRDRLNLERRMDSIIADLRKVAQLPDPVGEHFDEREPREGLRAWKQRTPLGVLGVIYEARPQVTVDVACPRAQERQRRHSARRARGAAQQHGAGARAIERHGRQLACPPPPSSTSTAATGASWASCCACMSTLT